MSGSAEELLSLRDAEVSFAKGRKLRFDDLRFNRGDRVALIGENGSGKSTLCKVLAGLIPLSAGRIVRSREFREGSIGYLPQSGGSFPDLTVSQNIDLVRRLYGVTEPFDPRLFKGFWDLGLAEVENAMVKNLSGGFAHLAALAAVLSVGAECLVLDEPFSGLDVVRKGAVIEAIEHSTASVDLLIVTAHSPDELLFANRIVRVGE